MPDNASICCICLSFIPILGCDALWNEILVPLDKLMVRAVNNKCAAADVNIYVGRMGVCVGKGRCGYVHEGVHPEGRRKKVSIQVSKCFQIICVAFDQAVNRAMSTNALSAAKSTYVLSLLTQPTCWPACRLLLVAERIPSIPKPDIVDDAEHKRLLPCIPLGLLGDETLKAQALGDRALWRLKGNTHLQSCRLFFENLNLRAIATLRFLECALCKSSARLSGMPDIRTHRRYNDTLLLMLLLE